MLDASLERRVLWKLDIHVLPPLALLWLANFIDRSNIGNARYSNQLQSSLRAQLFFRISGLEQDTHLQGNQFNTALAGSSVHCVQIHVAYWLLVFYLT